MTYRYEQTGTTRAFNPIDERITPPWDRVLVWLLRIMSLIWIVKGLWGWSLVLGVPVFSSGPEMPFNVQAITVYFCVLDLVAATGLWLTSAWGGVLWLLSVMSTLILAVFFPAIVAPNLLEGAALVALMIGYLATSWLAAHMDD